MTDRLRIALAQLNPVLGDIAGNLARARKAHGEAAKLGADLVLFSTDKLIGGPQGGMIAGCAGLIERIRAHPLYRILRVCKLTLGALEATLRLFKAPDLLAQKHPVYTMIAKTPAAMEPEARRLRRTCTSRSGVTHRPTISGLFASSNCSGGGMRGTSGTLAALTPRMAR